MNTQCSYNGLGWNWNEILSGIWKEAREAHRIKFGFEEGQGHSQVIAPYCHFLAEYYIDRRCTLEEGPFKSLDDMVSNIWTGHTCERILSDPLISSPKPNRSRNHRDLSGTAVTLPPIPAEPLFFKVDRQMTPTMKPVEPAVKLVTVEVRKPKPRPVPVPIPTKPADDIDTDRSIIQPQILGESHPLGDSVFDMDVTWDHSRNRSVKETSFYLSIHAQIL
jgi:hypothetical protein